MADSQDGAVGEYGFLYDNTDIDGSLCDAAMRDTYLFDEAVMLVELFSSLQYLTISINF